MRSLRGRILVLLFALSLSALLLHLLPDTTTRHPASSWHFNRGFHRRRFTRKPARLLQSEATHTSSCPAGCTTHGTCNEELGRCDCPRQYEGPDCATPVPNVTYVCARYGFTPSRCSHKAPCFNTCNNRGKCDAGVCHCKPGHYGIDCALSLDSSGKPELLAGQNYSLRSTAPKIYVYELPPNVTSWFNFHRIDRPLHMMFWQRLMSAGVRTLDGNEADYFYIPINSRSTICNELMRWAIPYIQRTWPWWDQDQGHKHLLIHTGDMGVIELAKDVWRMTENCTWLTHWGLVQDKPEALWKKAHRPGKDIVIPVALSAQQGLISSPLHPSARRYDRNGTMFFGGRICGDRMPPANGTCRPVREDYSANTRQRVYMAHHERPGFKVVPGTPTYLRDLSTHKYCLAPTGGGHGKRNILVALMGCVPVTVTDLVLQPFEPELRWTDFSVPVAEADIPRMHQILEDVPPAQLELMQSRLRCAAQHMFYSSSLGGVIGEDGRYDAFETIMEILRLRVEHPGVPPEQYLEVDERWRKFVNCELHDTAADGSEEPKLCTVSTRRGEKHPCTDCRHKIQHFYSGGGFFGWPGGAICCDERRIAQCPRLWT